MVERAFRHLGDDLRLAAVQLYKWFRGRHVLPAGALDRGREELEARRLWRGQGGRALVLPDPIWTEYGAGGSVDRRHYARSRSRDGGLPELLLGLGEGGLGLRQG